ncbi:hypothetical protein DES53_11322 [Roseimicrobium gellanilyticum]|uniref:Uncharacterized protein n=1 Tax=Roseimicrobium gellanilyticum TaxID=748857 RepID=A0A366H699_9BACT|nr:hypothetical protein [Roseimicrobium gellanilyticum]RBP37640.1 hypothetical protein DES53_11322 [Roseimicrobium gellanilyticum]
MKLSGKRIGHLVFAAIYLGAAGFFAYAFYDRFWKWRDELSQVSTSFTTPDGANVSSSGMIWILPAGIFAILGFLRIARYWRVSR